LTQLKCAKALKSEVWISANLTHAEKIYMINKAKSFSFMYQRYIKGYIEGSDDNNYVDKVEVITHDKVFDL